MNGGQSKMTTTAPKVYEIGQFVGYVPIEETVDLTPAPDASYYVLQTEPGREMTAQANLVLRRVPFYLPTILRAARLSARRHAAGEDHEDVAVPLFPRTILISEKVVAVKERIICSTPGMLSEPFMMFGECFARLRPFAMQVIQYIEAGEREVYYRAKGRKGAPVYMPKVGEAVKFMVDEVLGGRRGTVADIDDDGRISLWVEIMKRTVRVKTTADRIEPV
jgi:transcription antitermination factor NusG